MILRHIIGWLVLTVLSIIFLPWMINSQTYINKIQDDQKQLSSEIGFKSSDTIIKKTDALYNDIFEDSGFHPWVNEHYVHSLENDSSLFQKSNADKIANTLRGYIGTFFVSMYETTFHLVQIGYWSMIIFPFIVAAAFDGLMTRKVRILSFNYSSPTKYNALWHLMIALFSGTILYSNMPFAMPAIAFPLIVFTISMVLRSMLANMQRSA